MGTDVVVSCSVRITLDFPHLIALPASYVDRSGGFISQANSHAYVGWLVNFGFWLIAYFYMRSATNFREGDWLLHKRSAITLQMCWHPL